MEPARRHLEQRMREAGLEFGERSMTYNSRLAQELGKWADTQEGGDAVHMALFRAYFVEGRNLADIDVLIDTAESVGLDQDKAREVLEKRTFRTQVDQDWSRSHASGITGVPAFLCGKRLMVGCQPFEVMEEFIKQI